MVITMGVGGCRDYNSVMFEFCIIKTNTFLIKKVLEALYFGLLVFPVFHRKQILTTSVSLGNDEMLLRPQTLLHLC